MIHILNIVRIEMTPHLFEAKVFPSFAHKPTMTSESARRVGQLVARFARRGTSCFGSRRSRVRFSPLRPLHPHLIWPVSSNFLHCFRSYGQQITSLWLEQVHLFQSGIPPADSHTSTSLLRPIKFRFLLMLYRDYQGFLPAQKNRQSED